MARKAILVSDISGEEVTEENGATLRVTFPGSEEVWVLDTTLDEATTITHDKSGKFLGRVQGKRGRKAEGDSSEAKPDK